MFQPLISVVIPTYNSLEFLPNLRVSLLAQTYTNWECRFVDNSSTDGTWEFLEALCQEDDRFHCLRKPHDKNPTRSRNLGMGAARGQWIALCDSDDFWHPRKLEAQVGAISEGVAFIFTDRVIWREKVLPREFPTITQLSVETADAEEVLYKRNLITNSSCLIARSKLEDVGFLAEDLMGVDDYLLYLELSLRGAVKHIPQPLTYYFVHANNLSHNKMLMAQNLAKLAGHPRARAFPKKLRCQLWWQAYKSLAKAYMLQIMARLKRKA